MITVITKMTVRPQKQREFVQTILAMSDPSRKHSGLLRRDFYQDARNECRFVLMEEWKTRDDLDGHLRSEWFHILLGTRSLLEQEPQITFSFSHETFVPAGARCATEGQAAAVPANGEKP